MSDTWASERHQQRLPCPPLAATHDTPIPLLCHVSGITGQTSCPQVFIGGQFIGGCNDGGLGGVSATGFQLVTLGLTRGTLPASTKAAAIAALLPLLLFSPLRVARLLRCLVRSASHVPILATF